MTAYSTNPDDPQAAAVAIIAAADLPHTTLAGYIAALRETGCFHGLTHADALEVAEHVACTVETDPNAATRLLNTARDVLAGGGHWQDGQRYQVARAFSVAAHALT